MSIYSVNPTSAQNTTGDRLTFIGTSPVFGKIPRDFSFSGDVQSKYAAVANEVSNAIVVIERDPSTGLIGQLRGNYSFGAFDSTATLGPMAVVWE